MKKILAVLTVSAIAFGVQAELVSVTDADSNGYGDFSGLVIDFDATTGLAADWTPDLVNEQVYSVDSVSVWARGATYDADLYLGVYSGVANTNSSGAYTYGSFLGASDATANLATAGTGKVTWDFSGINVTADNVAGGGSGELFFVLQTATTAQNQLIDVGNTAGVRRIDGEGGSYTDELAAILHDDASFIKTTRAPEYEAQITAIPEPGTLGLVVLFGGGVLFIRRRMKR